MASSRSARVRSFRSQIPREPEPVMADDLIDRGGFARLPIQAFIVYRRLTMKMEQAEPLNRDMAAEYASWFKALADATRVQIVSLLARHAGPMSVGEITAAVQVGQSTVSAHLKVLAEVRFVLAERRGTAVFYRVNQACVECFPTAADLVMGRPVPAAPSC
jgi:DNA-binding transcriptional ArsR family regulator